MKYILYFEEDNDYIASSDHTDPGYRYTHAMIDAKQFDTKEEALEFVDKIGWNYSYRVFAYSPPIKTQFKLLE